MFCNLMSILKTPHGTDVDLEIEIKEFFMESLLIQNIHSTFVILSGRLRDNHFIHVPSHCVNKIPDFNSGIQFT